MTLPAPGLPSWMPPATALPRAANLAVATALLRPATGGTLAAIGWIGGLPALPDTTPWPEQAGVPAGFVTQLDLARLPPDLWPGSGPRTGWLRLFLTGDLTPLLIHTTKRGRIRPAPRHLPVPRWQTSRIAPAWPLALGSGDDVAHPDPGAELTFDLTHPGFRPLDHSSAIDLLDRLSAELDHSAATLAAITAEILPPATDDMPGGNGIWGRALRRNSAPERQEGQRRLVNSAVLQTGLCDIATARNTLKHLKSLLCRTADPLPAAMPELICAALGHVTLPLFALESADEAPHPPGTPTPVRLYQRSVPASRSAWAPRPAPRSRWAEDYAETLCDRAFQLLSSGKPITNAAQSDWWRAVAAYHADGAVLRLGQSDDNRSPGAVLSLPSTRLTGWSWGADGGKLAVQIAANSLESGAWSEASAHITP